MKYWHIMSRVVGACIIVFGVFVFGGLKAYAATSPLLDPSNPLWVASIIGAANEDPKKVLYANVIGGDTVFINYVGDNIGYANVIGSNTIFVNYIGSKLSYATVIGGGTIFFNYIGDKLSYANVIGGDTVFFNYIGDKLSYANVIGGQTTFFNYIGDSISYINIIGGDTVFFTMGSTKSSACVSSWQCSGWSMCIYGSQTRYCYDSNYCAVGTNKPATTQSCVVSPTPPPDPIVTPPAPTPTPLPGPTPQVLGAETKSLAERIAEANIGIKFDQTLTNRLKGRILLQVQSYGKAWYLYPKDGRRYFLGRPNDAFALMRKLGLGITDSDLKKIPRYGTSDVGDSTLVNRLKGRILLQVQKNGEAWYLSPVNGKRYFMGRPADAFSLMRSLGLGITNSDLNKIYIGLVE